MKFHERFVPMYSNSTAPAAMARSCKLQSDELKDMTLAPSVMNSGASITITGPLLNCVDMKELKTKIETAKEGESIVGTHVSQDNFL